MSLPNPGGSMFKMTKVKPAGKTSSHYDRVSGRTWKPPPAVKLSQFDSSTLHRLKK